MAKKKVAKKKVAKKAKKAKKKSARDVSTSAVFARRSVGDHLLVLRLADALNYDEKEPPENFSRRL